MDMSVFLFLFFKDKDLDYQCVLVIEGRSVVVDAFVEADDTQPSLFFITCQLHQVTTPMRLYYIKWSSITVTCL